MSQRPPEGMRHFSFAVVWVFSLWVGCVVYGEAGARWAASDWVLLGWGWLHWPGLEQAAAHAAGISMGLITAINVATGALFADFGSPREWLRGRADGDDLTKYINYLRDAGGSVSLEWFDGDWGSEGPDARRRLVQAGLAIESPGRGVITTLVPPKPPSTCAPCAP